MRCTIISLAIAAIASVAWAQPQSTDSGVVCIEGTFGKALINVKSPAMTELYLRGPDGQLAAQSLLAQQPVVAYPGYRNGTGVRPWARQGYTYVVGGDEARYESRLASAGKVEVGQEAGRTTLRITGVSLSDGKPDGVVVATEDWTLSAPGNGSQLVWNIVRRWNKDFTSVMSGSPALFFGFDARAVKNSVTSTIWYDPLRIAARWSDLYATVVRASGRISENRTQTIRDKDTWAIYKLWTNWHAPADLRLEVAGGHLYRRGSFAFLSEAGGVTNLSEMQNHRAGQVEEVTLKISAVDKYATGYQLVLTLPDKETEASLKDFYCSVLNGGAVNDQKGFDLGNETDGYYYAGSSWMQGMAIAAGVPAAGQLSSHSYTVTQAIREHLDHIVSTVGDDGRTRFGYNQSGDWVDDNLHTIIGIRAYLLHSGDLAFAAQHLAAMERMLDYFVKRRDEHGLFKLAANGAHWYYDCTRTEGVNGYYNAFLYKAAQDLAEMENAAGHPAKAKQYRDVAESVKEAFNAVMWRENAPGGARYVDWIDNQGNDVAYFCDLCQWPAVAVGIASPEQAQKIVATADARIKVLEKEYGYPGFAGLSALWPAPERVNLAPKTWPFGNYMNGGSLLSQTYWEIVARAKAGDSEGAARRLRLFAKRAAQTSWAGDNSANMMGERGNNDSGEPYLADMVVATAGAIHGLLGITPTWDRLTVIPHLPANWPRAEADVLYKGRRNRVVIDNGEVQIQPLEQVVVPPVTWTMDFNLRTSPGAVAVALNVDFIEPYGSAIVLKKSAASGTYQSPSHDWLLPAKLHELTVAGELNGGRVTAIVQTSDDGFRTIRAQGRIPVRDGVNAYSLDCVPNAATAARVQFDLSRGENAAATPTVDGFRVKGSQAGLTE